MADCGVNSWLVSCQIQKRTRKNREKVDIRSALGQTLRTARSSSGLNLRRIDNDLNLDRLLVDKHAIEVLGGLSSGLGLLEYDRGNTA